jgi:hypothetical protein
MKNSSSFCDDTLSPDAVRGALERILMSVGFMKSRQLNRFLRYIVEKTLEGQTDELKAYTIAIEVLDRSTDFDPQFDPLVRVRAGRLRRALERYYLTDGVNDPIRIDLPKGGPAESLLSQVVSRGVFFLLLQARGVRARARCSPAVQFPPPFLEPSSSSCSSRAIGTARRGANCV